MCPSVLPCPAALCAVLRPLVRWGWPVAPRPTPSPQRQRPHRGARTQGRGARRGTRAAAQHGSAVPDDARSSRASGGSGPSASKIYGITEGLSLGGYAEAKYSAHVYRQGRGEKNNGGLRSWRCSTSGTNSPTGCVFNSEIEFEHGSDQREWVGLDRVRHPRLPVARRAECTAGLDAPSHGLS